MAGLFLIEIPFKTVNRSYKILKNIGLLEQLYLLMMYFLKKRMLLLMFGGRMDFSTILDLIMINNY